MKAMSIKALAVGLSSIVFAGLAVVGCGGTAGNGDPVVAQVGSTKITESTLHHWMATFVRGDFYATIGTKAPAGLATDPPNYAACVAAAKTIEPRPSSGKPRLTGTQLEQKCHALYRDVRSEALSYLISVLWSIGEAGEMGRTVSDREVQKQIDTLITRTYKTQQAFFTYLDNKGWSLADMHYIVKRNLLSQLVNDVAANKAISQNGQRAFVNMVLRRNAKWTTKTKCQTGYLVWQCKGYKPTAPSDPSPAVLFEEIVGP
jgi:hypothetical protein